MSKVKHPALKYHAKYQGKLETKPIIKIKNKKDLSLAYAPGVAEPCREIAKNKDLAYDYSLRGRTVAVISDGSAVLGLGNIGPEAALPVMEGKAVLIKEFAGVDAVPIVIDTQDSKEIIKFVRQIAPSFAGINLEDISAPRCFKIEEALSNLGIPVFHDDQHGTAIAISAALKNASQVVGKRYEDLKVVIIGAGAAGLATAKILLGLDCRGDKCKSIPNEKRVKELIVLDRAGALYKGRPDLNKQKKAVAKFSNQNLLKGSLSQVIAGADAVIGVSGPDLIKISDIKKMAKEPIVFALANPNPEISPEKAKQAGAKVIATGRSDYPNQINNVLVFPGVFLAVTQGRLKNISLEMKLAASEAIAKLVPKPSVDKIIPDPFQPNLAKVVAKAILQARSKND